MQLTSQTELMENQKHADVMSPDIVFDVLQTPAGDALFFSIGTDGVFYVTREVRSTEVGWTRMDLSSSLSRTNGGVPIKAKAFDLSQNLASGRFDIALVATAQDSDVLYMTRGHSNEVTDWDKPVNWTEIPFDAATVIPPKLLTISDVYLMNIPSADDPMNLAVQNCFVDIIRTPGDPLKLLDRYYIHPDAPTKWTRQALPADLKADSISSCLGCRTHDFVPGIYTYGLIEHTQELLFTPQYNYFKPGLAPSTSRLTLPVAASAIASVPSKTGHTFLFVAAFSGLYLFSPDNQYDLAEAVLIVPAVMVGKYSLFTGVSSLVAITVKDRTVVWLKNAQGDLYYVTCNAGSELSAEAWSSAVPFCLGVEKFAFYLNGNNSNIVLFAHLYGQQMAEFTQNSAGEWSQRQILLPSTNLDDFIEFKSFTTTIKVVDSNGVGSSNVGVTLTAEKPVSAYVNNIYRLLSSEAPVLTTADANGILNIIQPTRSLSSVILKAALANDSSVNITIDPLTVPAEKLASIHSGSDLSKIQIKDANGNEKFLIPNDVSVQVRESVAGYITTLLAVRNELSTGRTTRADPEAVSLPSASTSSPMTVSFEQVNISVPEALANSIEIAAGDLFNFLRMTWQEFEGHVVKAAQGVWKFIVKIGQQIYNAVLDTVTAVFEAIETLFRRIKVSYDELVAWLGYLFDWGSILRTRTVIKHVLKQRATNAINSISSIQAAVETFFIDIEDKLNSWADITDPGEKIGILIQQHSNNSLTEALNSPQSHWALNHLRNGIDGAKFPGAEMSNDSDVLHQALNSLKELVSDETGHVETTITQIQEQVLAKFSELTAFEVFKKIIAIAGDLLLKSARSVVVKLLDIAKILLTGLLDLLDAPVHMPILSPYYKKIVGNEPSILDIVCLVGSIPTTVAYKLIRKQPPFPSDSAVASAIQTSDKISTARSATSSKAQPSGPPMTPSADVSFMMAQEIITDEKKVVKDPGVGDGQDSWDDKHVLIMVFDILAAPGALIVAVLAIPKWQTSTKNIETPRIVRWTYLFGYIMYAAPNFAAWQNADTWPVIMNNSITILSIIKSFVDAACLNKLWVKASPVLEFFINLIWLVPAAGGIITSDPRHDCDWTLFAANITFDIGGMLTPFADNPKVFAASETLTVAYGVLGAVTAKVYYENYH